MIVLMVLAMTSIQAVALTSEMPHDTIYFYNTWEQMFNEEPVIALVDPWIETITPYDVVITADDSRISDRVVAATLGDSIWLINTHYLRQNFGGDAKKLSDFVPLYFNEKVAFVVSDAAMSVKDILFGPSEDYYPEGDYFYIDFQNRKVLKVTPAVLSALLEDYHDLQMRYEGMKDYKKRHIIEDYFFKYVDRATQDFMRPTILELVDR